MNLRFYNTLSRMQEAFHPLVEDEVRMYTCGPTVHDFAHIGNFRAYIFEDLLRRTLRMAGSRVIQVMNLTDVDDKTIRKSQAAGVALNAFTQPYIDAFFEDLATLGIEKAEHYPRATEHIEAMIRLIERLLAKDFAYVSGDGSVYFRIDAYARYGELAHLDRSGLKAGARVDQDEYEKDSVGDFALWKAWSEADGPVAWDSPWGRGRPGWHIECSAMSLALLGESFDLHTGGVDNIFPHHEDERAQSEAATGKPFAHTWMHCAHLMVEGHKMAKSAGNFFTLRDLIGKGYTGREIRYALLSVHYRMPLNFTFASLDAARSALLRIDAFSDVLRSAAAGAKSLRIPEWADGAGRVFREAMADDLNVSAALAALFDLIHRGHREAAAGSWAAEEAAGAQEILNQMDRILGCVARPEISVDPQAHRLALEREAARKARNWAEADRLRDQIDALGWKVQDTPKGPELKPKS
ncbi:MAG: cysteine--tRNA ligase [Kiritimatiellia bacterium]|nr:cysteine--tRNA ligase [Kiritimatiellia bacterium]